MQLSAHRESNALQWDNSEAGRLNAVVLVLGNGTLARAQTSRMATHDSRASGGWTQITARPAPTILQVRYTGTLQKSSLCITSAALPG